jgi:3-deoxy-D-manno-octulosonic-acid transferase
VSRVAAIGTPVPKALISGLGDSMGEMAMYFALSDVALLGGSFAPLGGQNLIEAAACGCPVVMGPHTFNFSQAAAWAVQAGAAFEQADMALAVNCALRLVRSSSDLQGARAAALASGATHRGAAQRTAVAVGQLLLSQPTGG